jgi:hypothetical protein
MNHVLQPRLSVVIPTHGRPRYVVRAIESALLSAPDMDIEIVVVPNGPDDAWKAVAARFEADPRVRWDPIAIAHANAARNHGLTSARGQYVRFLDDDDVLYPDASRRQCLLLEQAGADICSGSVDLTTEDSRIFGVRTIPATNDFIESILAPGRVVLPTAHVYRRDAVAALRWDESLPLGQDMRWMHQLCTHGEWKWVRFEPPVGAWLHHAGPRTSRSRSRSQRGVLQVEMLLELVSSLERQQRLSPTRAMAASRSLWRLICGHYHFAPRYWSGILAVAQATFPGTYPELAIYRTALGRCLPPKTMLAAARPLQMAKHRLDRIRERLGLLPGDVVA